jgi:hypothetical protein
MNVLARILASCCGKTAYASSAAALLLLRFYLTGRRTCIMDTYPKT